MNWAIFLHFYQPTSQQREVIENVVTTAYRPILSLLESYASARVSININACLTEQLEFYGFDDVLHSLRKHALKGKIEFVASAKNHAFLPLIPEYEIEWQIQEGLQTNKRILGKIYQPLGFFPTELGVSHRVAKVSKQQGFDYILADEISLAGSFSSLDGQNVLSSRLYQVAGCNGLTAFFPNRYLGDLIRATSDLNVSDFQRKFVNLVNKDAFSSQKGYLISANDAEVFGHHYASRHEILKWVFEQSESGKLSLVTFKDLLSQIDQKEEIQLLKGSWETSQKDLEEEKPFPLWYDPENSIQKLQWELAWKGIESLNRAKKRGEVLKSKTFQMARQHLTRGLHSCYFWWASCKPWWHPDMVVDGVTQLIKVVRTLDTLEAQERTEAEETYIKIIQLVWQWHWGGEAQKRIDIFEEERKTGLFWVRRQPAKF